VLSLKSAFRVFADSKLGAKKSEHVLHQREQIGDLAIRAPFQAFSELCPDPERPEPFKNVVRSRQPLLVPEQFPNRNVFW